MGFGEAVKTCFTRYAEFRGRAQRPEFWWFMLFLVIVGAAARILGEGVSALFSLATIVPSLAVGARRLHDTARSAWWLLLWLVPLVGWIVLLIFMAQEGSAAANQYDLSSAA